jgi:SAM-dependent methyltransferase
MDEGDRCILVGPSAGTVLADVETLHFYEQNARTYTGARPDEPSEDLLAFLPRLQSGASILELGCGSGTDAAEMERLGFNVLPTDGSAAMAAIASERLGRKIDVLRFEDLNVERQYDAVVACASLLHVPFEGLPTVLQRIWSSLKPGGWHFASFKTDSEAARDEHGRYYNYLDRSAAAIAYQAAGNWSTISFEHYDGVGHFSAPARWLTVTAQKSA